MGEKEYKAAIDAQRGGCARVLCDRVDGLARSRAAHEEVQEPGQCQCDGKNQDSRPGQPDAADLQRRARVRHRDRAHIGAEGLEQHVDQEHVQSEGQYQRHEQRTPDHALEQHPLQPHTQNKQHRS
jgi:hypothetical protein